jgi:hypothetical protein
VRIDAVMKRRLPPRLLGAFLLLIWGCAMAASAAESVLPAKDWKAIQKVIAEQRTALVAGDAEKAFGFASPAIRAQMNDAATFLAMVRNGYDALLTARSAQFLDGAVVNDVVVQPLRLIGRDDVVHVALYTMERQANGTWRISGCAIAPSTSLAT